MYDGESRLAGTGSDDTACQRLLWSLEAMTKLTNNSSVARVWVIPADFACHEAHGHREAYMRVYETISKIHGILIVVCDNHAISGSMFSSYTGQTLIDPTEFPETLARGINMWLPSCLPHATSYHYVMRLQRVVARALSYNSYSGIEFLFVQCGIECTPDEHREAVRGFVSHFLCKEGSLALATFERLQALKCWFMNSRYVGLKVTDPPFLNIEISYRQGGQKAHWKPIESSIQLYETVIGNFGAFDNTDGALPSLEKYLMDAGLMSHLASSGLMWDMDGSGVTVKAFHSDYSPPSPPSARTDRTMRSAAPVSKGKAPSSVASHDRSSGSRGSSSSSSNTVGQKREARPSEFDPQESRAKKSPSSHRGTDASGSARLGAILAPSTGAYPQGPPAETAPRGLVGLPLNPGVIPMNVVRPGMAPTNVGQSQSVPPSQVVAEEPMYDDAPSAREHLGQPGFGQLSFVRVPSLPGRNCVLTSLFPVSGWTCLDTIPLGCN